MTCLFCKIIKQEIPAKIIHDDEYVIAFDDINPQAPVHKIIIPKKHIATINDASIEDTHVLGHLIQVAKKIAHDNQIAENGYRLVMNCQSDGGQTVYHIHLHLIGGRQMTWPPG